MKKLFNLILWSLIFNSLAISVEAQDNSTCFMLDTNGNQVDLGYLCQNSSRRSKSPAIDRLRGRAIAVPQRNQTIKKSEANIVPIKSRRGGIPVIDVKFNDRYTFEMMLDTGASSVVITQKMADILKVSHHKNVWVSTPSSNHVKMSSGYVYSVEVGRLTQKNSLVITAPTMDMGLLGQSFFSRYDMTIKSDVIEFRER